VIRESNQKTSLRDYARLANASGTPIQPHEFKGFAEIRQLNRLGGCQYLTW
jgi:hypothetical protein